MKAKAVVLDAGPLGLVTRRRRQFNEADAASEWMEALESAGVVIYVPEIADYELRRELLRAGKTASIRRLDAFIDTWPGRYLPITTATMRRAAELWAQAR